MNAKQNKQPPATMAWVAEDQLGLDSALSALLDGELPASELDGWLRGAAPSTSAAVRCHTYQLIGESLRGQRAALPAQSPAQFLASVQARLAHEPLESGEMVPSPATVQPMRGPAANDAVFRWKLLAGVASLAAVMAVSWTVLGTTAGRAGNTGSPQLALTAPVAPASSLAQVGTEPVAVSTSQGVLVRDAQLEALMAEHRKFGGVSALQMPAGFLRNATYDANGR